MPEVQRKLNKQVMDLLTEDQKIVFLKSMLFLSKIDKKVVDEEVAFLKKMAQKYKVSDIKRIFQDTTEDELLTELSTLSNRRVALELIKELFLLGHTDRNLTDDELMFIMRVGRATNVESEKIEQISEWVIDFLVWQAEGPIIFEEDN